MAETKTAAPIVDKEKAMQDLVEVLKRRLLSPKRGVRSRFLACAAWTVDEQPLEHKTDSVPSSDVRQCRDAVRAILGHGKSRSDTDLRSRLRHLVLTKTPPSEALAIDKRLVDIVADLRKRMSVALKDVSFGSTTTSTTTTSAPLSNAIASSQTPRQDTSDASISCEESLRRRVLELEQELEKTKQSLEH